MNWKVNVEVVVSDTTLKKIISNHWAVSGVWSFGGGPV